MGEMQTSHTTYDDVFRTLLNDCRGLIVPLINELFEENYSGAEEIVFSVNEHFMNQQDGNMEKRITDTCFKILGREARKYHLECQSGSDNSMVVRIFEYDTQIALDDGEIRGNTLTVTFPHSAVLFLRSNSATPDSMKIKMVTPGGEVAYDVPVMKTQQYSLDEIFEKRLLFLLPFYVFSHESRFEEYEQDEKKLELLKQECAQIKGRLENLVVRGEISEYTYRMIIELSGKVVKHIAEKYTSVQKGVNSVMVGGVIETEAHRILWKGIQQGREEGQQEGWRKGQKDGWHKGQQEGIRNMVSTLMELNIPSQTILAKVQEKYHLTAKEAQEYLEAVVK